MKRVLHLFLIALCAAATFLCVTLGMAALAAKQTITKANQTLTKLDPIIADLDSAVKRADLLEKNAQYLILNLGLTANQVRAQSIKEGKALDIMTAQVQTTLTHVDSFVVTGRETELALQASINLTTMNTQPVLAQAHDGLLELTASLQSLHKVISDPAIPATLKATQKASEATADSMVEVKGMAIEGHQWVHSVLHPTWPGRIYHVGLDLAKTLKPW